MWPVDRVVPTMSGLFMLAAAALKIQAPAPAVGALAHVLQPVWEIGPEAGAGLAMDLILTETVLGLALVASPTRIVRCFAALTFIAFAMVLIFRFTVANAPSCGCLGRMFASEHTHQAWLDAARNGMFALALLATLARGTLGDAHPRQRSLASSRAGFTLIKTLVTITVKAVLIALVAPGLARMRLGAKVTRSLSAQQQIVASVQVYAQNYKDYFPHFEPLGGLAGPVRIRGATVMEGYFRAHMGFWLAAVGPDDDALINLAVWPPRSRGAATPGEEAIGLYYSVYYMSPTVAADPTAFAPPLAGSPALDPALLRGVRWDEMSFPSRKGLFLDFALFRTGARDEPIVAAFGDGSAAELLSDTPPEPIVPQPAQGPQTIVMSTRNGIRGVDR